MPDSHKTDIAVVGLGPRGLGALEALASRVNRSGDPIRVDVFEPSHTPGAGPNFDPDESPVCQLNIPMRDIDIRPPDFARCGAFADWTDDAPGPDVFPPRAQLGRYLAARYADLRQHGGLTLRHGRTPIDGLSRSGAGWLLHAGSNLHGPYAEVLLTLGQPEVAPDDQLAEWQAHAGRTDARLQQAYPAWRLQRDAADWAGQTVAVRGLALSAFDVIRVLTLGQGGRFESGRYIASGREPACIVPFSLDGRPPYPKPATAALDTLFAPSSKETALFARTITAAAAASPAEARARVSEALVPAVTRVLDTCGAPKGRDQVAEWLRSEWDDPGAQETDSGLEALQDGIAMAAGRAAPSIGFVVGQVWRKWQNALRRGYNPARTSPETARMLVGFDEGLKRYSYGPPIFASRELAALVKAGPVTLEFTAAPDISLKPSGWTLAANGRSIDASVMVDGVLPSPHLSPVQDALLTRLMQDGLLRPIAEGLAADIAPDGQLIDRNGAIVPGLGFLGRLALGSVIAADSLHDCFGQAAVRWAEGVMARRSPAAP